MWPEYVGGDKRQQQQQQQQQEEEAEVAMTNLQRFQQKRSEFEIMQQQLLM
jgi:hypothetical protein